jgi:hypothetical protein
MTDRPARHDLAAIPFLVVGAFLGAYAQNRRQRPKRASKPVPNLHARQAMAVARIANVVGIVAMVVFVCYYVYALSLLYFNR